MKNKLKYALQLFAVGFAMWAFVFAGLKEVFGATGGTLFLAAVVVLGVFIAIYFYGDKLTHLKSQ